MFAGAGHTTSDGNTVVRTKTHGMGTMSLEEFRANCNEFTGTFDEPCGDWAPLGTTALTAAAWGDRAGRKMTSIVERAEQNTSTLWAATTNGRVFIKPDADAGPGQRG